LFFFSATGISQRFLKKDPSEWANDPNFIHGKNITKDLKVVNDCAERGVALITRYLRGNKHTVDEAGRQHLLLVAAEDRKKRTSQIENPSKYIISFSDKV